ncbi:MAG: hypothetical protein ACK50O_01445, partial [Pirellulaceae bacterium]
DSISNKLTVAIDNPEINRIADQIMTTKPEKKQKPSIPSKRWVAPIGKVGGTDWKIVLKLEACRELMDNGCRA